MAEMERIEFATPGEFERWLEVHGATSPSIGLVLAKKGAPRTTVTYAEALEVALCHGWIDGGKGKLDDHFWVQNFSRRKPRSIWSQVNRDKALRLIEEGRMRPAGLAAIEAAQASGAWEAAYQPTRSRDIPEELDRALEASPKARAFFDTLDSRNRFAFVFRSTNAKKAETRIRRIEQFIRMLENGEVFYPKERNHVQGQM